jgi:hypothetical protein
MTFYLLIQRIYVNNFFGFPKPRRAGFGSPDIPSGDIPLDTADEDVVLEGTIVDFGEASRKINLPDSEPGILDPFKFVNSGEDINDFLRRMMGGADLPSRYTQDDVSGTVLIDNDEDPEEVPEPKVENAESVEDMLKVMDNENEKLENFIANAMKNIKH